MACPTCDHTMQGLGIAESGQLFWCPRCGHLKTECPGGHVDYDQPKLVERVRKFLEDLNSTDSAIAYMLGIPEACQLPKDR